MSASSLAEPPPAGQPVAVDGIESFLRETWEASETSCRASLYNLVLYTQQIGSVESNTEILAAIAQNHACRALLVCAPLGDEARDARAWVTAHCSFDRESGRSLCSEQITFLVRGFGPTDLASIVFPHLLSDLPVVFWWQGELNEQLISPLSRHIDRLLFDSSTWTDSRGCVLHLLERHHKRRKPFILHDLTWARTFAFRLALAAAFEEPAARRQLGRMRRIRLIHGTDGTAMAKLFLAWIATRTGWTCTSWEHASVQLRPKSKAPVDCSIEARAESGGLLEVILESGEGVFRLMRRENFVELHVNVAEHETTHFFPLQPSDPAALVSQILGRGGNNAVYLAVLRFLRDHFGAAESCQ